MINIATTIKAIVDIIQPFDDIERDIKLDVIDWVDSGAQLFRISKPDNPNKHLVSYFVLFDDINNSVLLIDHIKSHLWLPTGGHVDIDEDPYDTAVREAYEELHITADFTTPFGSNPFFVTATVTNGCGYHTDVSLWYIIKGDSTKELWFDKQEMNGYKWLTLDEILLTDISTMDEQMHRFTNKMKQFLDRTNK